MATINQAFGQLQQQFAILGHKISSFFSFIGNKVAHFTKLTLGEQISYGTIILGLTLIITSIILFVL